MRKFALIAIGAAVVAVAQPAFAAPSWNTLAAFRGAYNEMVNDAIARGVPMQPICFRDYCANQMIDNVNGAVVLLANVNVTGGANFQEICTGSLSERTCGSSIGRVWTERHVNGAWTTVQVIADHFDDE